MTFPNPFPRRGRAALLSLALLLVLAEALLLPARRLPELRLTDLELERGDLALARLDALSLAHRAGGVQLAATGVLRSERRVRFDVVLDWGEHDRLVGRATFHVPDATR